MDAVDDLLFWFLGHLPRNGLAKIMGKKDGKSTGGQSDRLSLYGMTPEEALKKALNTPPPREDEEKAEDDEPELRCVLTRPAWFDSRTEFLREWDRSAHVVFKDPTSCNQFRDLFAAMTDEEYRTMEFTDERMGHLADIMKWPARTLREFLRKMQKEVFHR